MEAVELDDWWLLEQVDPWGQLREDIRFAQQTAFLVAAAGAKKANGGAWKPEDFILKFDPDYEPPQPKKQTPKDLERILLRWAKAVNKGFGKDEFGR